MALAPSQFRRLVLGLHAGGGSAAIAFAADFAAILDVELVGVYFADAGLAGLAGWPAARAIAPGGAWRGIDWDAMISLQERAAGGAERRFAEAARQAPRSRFEILRGASGEALASISRSDDLLVIDAPAGAGGRAAEPFASLIAVAFRSASAVLLTPPRLESPQGPIVAFAARADDPSVATAEAIGERTGARVNVVQVRPGGLARVAASPRGAPGLFAFAAETAEQALRETRARLAVVSRDDSTADLELALALARLAPVLTVAARDGDAI